MHNLASFFVKVSLGSQPTLPGEVLTNLFGATVGYGNGFVR